MSWHALLAARRDAQLRRPMDAQALAAALTPLGYSNVVNDCAIQLQLRSAQTATQVSSCCVAGADQVAESSPTSRMTAHNSLCVSSNRAARAPAGAPGGVPTGH
jgi:hypothetical protein